MAGVLASVVVVGCAEPEIYCASARGDFAVEYTLESGAGPCATLVGDTVGMQSYNAIRHGRPDFGDTKVAVQPLYIGDLFYRASTQGLTDPDADDKPYSLGDFTTAYPDDDGFCAAPKLAPAHQVLPELPAIPDDPETPDVDETLPVQPATDVAFEWSDLRFYVTPDSQGTQFTGAMRFTQDGCAAEYRARGVFPAVACTSDDECNDDANGMNPSFAVHCNLDLELCVLDDDPPSFE